MKYRAMLLVGLVVLAPMGVQAASLIDFVGFSYEVGHFPPSNPGDELNFVAIVDGLTPPLSWDPANNEYTLNLANLVSNGAQHPDPNNIVVNYTGGGLGLYEDSAFNANPGIDPPNASAPATYIDGSLYLNGSLNSFTIFYNTQFNSGAFEADVTFTGGPHYGELGGQHTGYTFGGVFVFGVPHGYDLQWDGQILLDPVAVEAKTWGAVKSQFLR